jgi:hypothetical protein
VSFGFGPRFFGGFGAGFTALAFLFLGFHFANDMMTLPACFLVYWNGITTAIVFISVLRVALPKRRNPQASGTTVRQR